MKKLFFTFIFISGVAAVSFGQNVTTQKKNAVQAAASKSAADKQAAVAAQNAAQSANDLDPASLTGAANGVQPKTVSKFNKAKAAPRATPVVKAK